MVTEMLEKTPREPFHNIHRSNWQIFTCVVQKIVVNILWKSIAEPLNAYMWKYFEEYTAAKGLLKRCFSQSSFVQTVAVYEEIKRIEKW